MKNFYSWKLSFQFCIDCLKFIDIKYFLCVNLSIIATKDQNVLMYEFIPPSFVIKGLQNGGTYVIRSECEMLLFVFEILFRIINTKQNLKLEILN